ncbi:DUF6274 family protein [Streptomyces spectabilis]|uniref:Uncharacterized protein n=1 Tax=Streptomyces spectabilis TaxID=68270 RepID=A0A5P2XED2_STRST|nr:DUF6274 family protein [Streptomyces spectabilis]MBB5104113.1 hypothetical protein [Streptomyces spectabilis]MCI3903657.1 DUF6274 family protein [Streptomyces spectabilis]QEV60842.1 hypothetical protein CP982_20735 [Streptomyces spectabilis]GGV39700.1 hypothetical protein GCM10010245_62600 [Streptomyces spectabilis]
MTPVPASARHETRALLRAHLAAASSYRHLTRHCPICHRLLRLAMEPADDAHEATEAPEAAERHSGQCEDESPPKA